MLVTVIWHLYPMGSVGIIEEFIPLLGIWEHSSFSTMLSQNRPDTVRESSLRHKLEFRHFVVSYPLLNCLSHKIFSTNCVLLFYRMWLTDFLSHFPAIWHFPFEPNSVAFFLVFSVSFSFHTKSLFVAWQHPCCLEQASDTVWYPPLIAF